MGSIYIRPATIEDAASVSQIQYEALDKFHNFYSGFLATHPRNILPITTKTAINNPKNIFLVAVDAATDEVVGFVRYAIVPEKQPEEENEAKEKEKEDAKSQLDRSQPEFANLFAPKEHVKGLWEEFSTRDDEMDACYERVAKGQKHYYIKHLMISPTHQRRGIGAKLLSTVLAKSDTEHLPSFLTSSAEAHPLYTKLGFVDFGPDFRIDNEGWARRIMEVEEGLGVDENYMAFLDKANKQRDAGRDEAHTEESTQPSKQVRTETVESGVKVPEQLKKVDVYYMSETDEPFEPVALNWKGASSGKWPGNDEFASLIASGSEPDIEILSEKSFDPRSQYSDVIKAVRAAVAASDSKVNESDVEVKVYRVEVGHSRVEYWVIALDGAEGKIVGLRAKAIES
ncbi:hypothetical protein ZTR_05763 [Talaromyces verruculosus]|nr:hypothetical protein ZTR_05763 [Talaromyces verruculosus]